MWRTEHEAARVKERLLKVLVERGQEMGAGPPSLTTSGPHTPGWAGPRSRWNTEQDGTRREELLRRLEEETVRRDGSSGVRLRCRRPPRPPPAPLQQQTAYSQRVRYEHKVVGKPGQILLHPPDSFTDS